MSLRRLAVQQGVQQDGAVNCLSDLIFVLARVLNRMNGGDDVYWKSERLKRSME